MATSKARCSECGQNIHCVLVKGVWTMADHFPIGRRVASAPRMTKCDGRPTVILTTFEQDADLEPEPKSDGA